ncbi:hypothetical protein [Bifidobacterium vansinderenii]|uniref:Uncharacterized protein n=1 Tax=Bifidobacterium vansinderenii TaxID=1984871 RepID=A0A229VYC7_9BIFI|nr:hypothetical protein [Bifidobacterium vansinderenii]OXN00400.1 hypothetical protein Tam10B_1270 [Bifidobacterium vansinderenii]
MSVDDGLSEALSMRGEEDARMARIVGPAVDSTTDIEDDDDDWRNDGYAHYPDGSFVMNPDRDGWVGPDDVMNDPGDGIPLDGPVHAGVDYGYEDVMGMPARLARSVTYWQEDLVPRLLDYAKGRVNLVLKHYAERAGVPGIDTLPIEILVEDALDEHIISRERLDDIMRCVADTTGGWALRELQLDPPAFRAAALAAARITDYYDPEAGDREWETDPEWLEQAEYVVEKTRERRQQHRAGSRKWHPTPNRPPLPPESWPGHEKQVLASWARERAFEVYGSICMDEQCVVMDVPLYSESIYRYGPLEPKAREALQRLVTRTIWFRRDVQLSVGEGNPKELLPEGYVNRAGAPLPGYTDRQRQAHVILHAALEQAPGLSGEAQLERDFIRTTPVPIPDNPLDWRYAPFEEPWWVWRRAE